MNWNARLGRRASSIGIDGFVADSLACELGGGAFLRQYVTKVWSMKHRSFCYRVTQK